MSRYKVGETVDIVYYSRVWNRGVIRTDEKHHVYIVDISPDLHCYVLDTDLRKVSALQLLGEQAETN